ncbi:alpha/beta hydrolase [Microbacterium arborescens]|uniref:alpha/beta hydrolase n=1 Tax=Microbacterium TaxID=33882 RepID=UPI0025A27CD9|nr:alpha/beta hydrolase [Microbacterium arborescens]MDF2583717.1 hypothetical protein [Mycobacterium sp.]WJM14900.1 alpha/beta hydrolase [Microbacterium arborescens]
MSVQWTLDNPGAGVPADIRAETGRRDTMSTLARSAAGNTTSAAPTSGWQGKAASALTGRTAQLSAELRILSDHAATHAGILRRYAAEVEAIKAEHAILASSHQQTAHIFARAHREHDAIAMFVEGSVVDEKARLASRIDTLEADIAGLNARLRILADRRAAADNTAIMALTSPEARGDISGILANTVGLPGSAAASGHTPSLEQLAELSEVELAILFALQPGLARQLQSESQPADVAAWWRTLTTDQQAAFVLGAPALIGSLGGITPASRVAANLVNAYHRIQAIDAEQASTAALAAERGGRYSMPGALANASTLAQEREYLERAVRGDIQLYLYDPEQGALIEMTGDPATAKSVLFVVPGTNTTMQSFMGAGDVTDFATWQVENAYEHAPVLAFTVLAGAMPQLSANIFEGPQNNTIATAAGANYARFVKEIDASMPSLPTMSYEHSAGSQVGSAAEQDNARFDIRYLAAGVGATDGFQTSADTKYFAAQAPDDINRYYAGIQVGDVGYGVGPEEFAGVEIVDTGVPTQGATDNLRDISFGLALPGAWPTAAFATANLISDSVTHHNYVFSANVSLNGPVLDHVRQQLAGIGGVQ